MRNVVSMHCICSSVQDLKYSIEQYHEEHTICVFIVQGLMGVFFYVQSPTLSQNLAFYQEDFAAMNYSYTYIDGLYLQNAYNCRRLDV